MFWDQTNRRGRLSQRQGSACHAIPLKPFRPALGVDPRPQPIPTSLSLHSYTRISLGISDVLSSFPSTAPQVVEYRDIELARSLLSIPFCFSSSACLLAVSRFYSPVRHEILLSLRITLRTGVTAICRSTLSLLLPCSLGMASVQISEELMVRKTTPRLICLTNSSQGGTLLPQQAGSHQRLPQL